ncbi:MAG TPA: ubiquitin-like domain-containing protein [Candidatus Saccharimonadales bacterium]|nr:ubiquitin-like domain-containing protein [Candidatus Saccharimonadales bacterium]
MKFTKLIQPKVLFKRKTGRYTPRWLKLSQHPFFIPVSTFVVMFFMAMILFIGIGGRTIGASDAKVVKFNINGQKQTILTRAPTVADFLKRVKVTLNEGDVVEPSLDTPILEDDFRINIYRARPVTVFDGDKRIQTLSAATTPRSVALQAGLKVYPEDNVDVAPIDNLLKEGIVGQKIVIKRATPVYVNLYGTPVTIRTHAKTVALLLKDKGIKIEPGDELRPARNTPITPSIQIFVVRNGTQLTTVEEAIGAPTQVISDPNLSFGSTAIRQLGSSGKRIVTYQIDMRNGQETGRHVIQSVIVTDPVTEIIARGTAIYIPPDTGSIMAAAGIRSSDYAYVNYIISRESGWCPTKWQGQIGYCPASYQPIHDPSSGYGFGLCQSTPAIKMSSAGGDWMSNPVTQLKWCSGYATGRYGSWGAAYNHWLNYHSW